MKTKTLINGIVQKENKIMYSDGTWANGSLIKAYYFNNDVKSFLIHNKFEHFSIAILDESGLVNKLSEKKI